MPERITSIAGTQWLSYIYAIEANICILTFGAPSPPPYSKTMIYVKSWRCKWYTMHINTPLTTSILDHLCIAIVYRYSIMKTKIYIHIDVFTSKLLFVLKICKHLNTLNWRSLNKNYKLMNTLFSRLEDY